MIVLADTIAHPRAVVIHPHDAPSANRTMMHSLFLDHVALKAIANFV